MQTSTACETKNQQSQKSADELRAENEHLRDLIVQLSRIVVNQVLRRA